MLMRDYQAFAAQGLDPALDQQGLFILGGLGVAGEGGEVADEIKKGLFHADHPLDADKLILEMGDVLWYLATLCTALGIDMGLVAAENQRKLRERYPAQYPAPSNIILAGQR